MTYSEQDKWKVEVRAMLDLLTEIKGGNISNALNSDCGFARNKLYDVLHEIENHDIEVE